MRGEGGLRFEGGGGGAKGCRAGCAPQQPRHGKEGPSRTMWIRNAEERKFSNLQQLRGAFNATGEGSYLGHNEASRIDVDSVHRGLLANLRRCQGAISLLLISRIECLFKK